MEAIFSLFNETFNQPNNLTDEFTTGGLYFELCSKYFKFLEIIQYNFLVKVNGPLNMDSFTISIFDLMENDNPHD